MPPIRLAPIIWRRDGRKRFMRMAPVRRRNPRSGMGSIRGGSMRGGMRQRQQSMSIAWEVSPSARRQYRDRLNFQKCALARKLRDFEGGAGGRRGDVHELVAHLAIDRKLRANVGQKGVKLDDVFHLAADALDGSFQVFVDQRRLLAEIRTLLAGAVISELSRDVDRASGATHFDHMGVAGRLSHRCRIAVADVGRLCRGRAKHHNRCTNGEDGQPDENEIALHEAPSVFEELVSDHSPRRVLCRAAKRKMSYGRAAERFVDAMRSIITWKAS